MILRRSRAGHGPEFGAGPVSPLRNAATISGETLSAAAFLGTAGMVLAYGFDMLWLPVGVAAGFVVMLALVTAPLRRSGAATLTDFAEWRLGSRAAGVAVSCCVCCVGWLYLLSQFQGAGVALRTVTGAPYWAGWLLLGGCVLVTALCARGRRAPVACAHRFWLKLIVIGLPAVLLVTMWRLRHGPDPMLAELPGFLRTTTVVLGLDAAVQVPVDSQVRVAGILDNERYDGDDVLLAAGRHLVAEGTRLTFTVGTPVPHAERLPMLDGAGWAMPFTGGGEHPLFAVSSLLTGLMLGTMGLPYIVARFSANAGGRSARRSAALVPVLLSMFFAFPTLYGALGRLYTPELLMTGETDATVLLLPQRLVPGLPGLLVSAVLATGALAAFVAAAWGTVIVLARTIAWQPAEGGSAARFRLGVGVALLVPALMLDRMAPLGSVGLVVAALSVSACSLCPVLVLGIWWRRLTAAGATTGLAVGGGLSAAAAAAHLLRGPVDGWTGAVLAQPALAVAPAAFLVAVLVSLMTPRRVPPRADRLMARLHVPEKVIGEYGLGYGFERS